MHSYIARTGSWSRLKMLEWRDSANEHQVSGRKNRFNYWLNSPSRLVEIFQIWCFLPQYCFLLILYASYSKGFQTFSWQTFPRWDFQVLKPEVMWHHRFLAPGRKNGGCSNQVKSRKWGSAWCSMPSNHLWHITRDWWREICAAPDTHLN